MGRRGKNPHDGIFNINKPAGMTSHDVVDAVRKLLRQRRVGHAGTLDPTATGVLLVCVGRATRLCEYLVEGEKEYRGRVRLGVSTKTYDTEGAVVAETDTSGVTREQVEATLERFVGEIEQRPPAYSAIKKDGVPAYKLARRGENVEMATRKVRISSLELVGWEPPEAEILVRCQSGTYVRSLAHDIGATLGVGGHLSTLRRTASGSWRLEETVTLEEIEKAIEEEDLGRVLHPFDDALRELPRVTLRPSDVDALSCGRDVHLDVALEARQVCAHDVEGRLIAVIEPVSRTRWKPRKVFPR